MDFSNLIPNISEKIEQWIQEDIPAFDIGGFVVGSSKKKAILYCKSAGIIAGVPFVTQIFEKLQCNITWLVKEGDLIQPEEKKEIAYISGNINQILIGERLILNILSRTSGIATKSFNLVTLAKEKGFSGKIAGTRKTTPGFRLVEKYGLLVGGADTHRMDLSSMVMLKDNHIKAMGGIKEAVTKARYVSSVWTKIEVECSSYEHAIEALESGTDIIMLDNLKPEILKNVASKIKKKFPYSVLEASGGITESNIQLQELIIKKTEPTIIYLNKYKADTD